MKGWPLSGRREEIALFERLVGGPAGEAGVVIAGGAGVGKTRLAREAAAAAAQRGWVVRSVQGTAAAQTIPLGAFAQWIDHQDDDPLAGVRAVIAALTESPRNAPVLVVVDDGQLLDDQSAFVVRAGGRRCLGVVEGRMPKSC